MIFLDDMIVHWSDDRKRATGSPDALINCSLPLILSSLGPRIRYRPQSHHLNHFSDHSALL